MQSSDIWHVAIAPSGILKEGLAEKVAAVMGSDVYDARRLLAGKIPRIIAQYHSVEEAETIVRKLRSEGIAAFACGDAELRKPLLRIFRARSLKKADGEVIFKDKTGREISLREKDVFLILEGTMQTSMVKESTSTTVKLNVMGTVLTGGIPIMRQVKEKTKEISVDTERFVRLYGRASMDPVVELFQRGFDYSFLGAGMTSSSLKNMDGTIAELRKIFPQTVFDDLLIKPSGSNVRDALEINCRLIYLYHRAVDNLGRPA